MSAIRRGTVLTGVRAATPARQAFLLLRTVFTVAPILFGLDRFTNGVADWPRYLAPLIGDYLDIALRDFGLLVAALALSRLAVTEDARGGTRGLR